MNRKWRCTLKILVVTAPGLVIGCAHAPAQASSVRAAEAPAVAAPAHHPDSNARPATAHEAEDVRALVEGSIIHFDFDAYRLTSESRQRLQRLADLLRAHPAMAIRVTGNCDDRGTEEYNLALGQQRALVARKYLVDLGIDSTRIQTVTYGEERPLDSRETEDAWAANRRDEFAVAGSQ
jgi:peptidoglycan-associated lipoprotein